MINAEITIRDIDYEKSFANLFPVGLEKCKKIENPNLAIRFLLKMGDASMEAALGVLNRMEEKSKGELLCGLVNLYGREIQSSLNAVLQEDELGRNICIGDIYMTQDTEGWLSLMVGNIKIDYGSLLKNDTVKQKIGDIAGDAIRKTMFGGSDTLRKVVEETAGSVAEFAVGAAPNMAEKKALSVISRRENKNKMLHMARRVLEEKGLCVNLEDFAFAQEKYPGMQGEVIGKNAKERKFEMSTTLEDELLDAVVGYLKMLTKTF